ncbi:hypothetical protein JTE90_028951 [Oedothorax gibbosus]|uniref:Anaphase-promoting complex subunit 4 n=1 Tax=Oedothorax gibbosus TaxID=931172 RepID=A0AAV6VJ82_9ARAC|nr:hypothetical protein JTE90_028951 [Oedothorax gibbosus]
MSSFRQVAQGYVDSEIMLMEWNPTKDAIALTTVLGEVLLYSCSWQLVWNGITYIRSKNTFEKTILATAITWRPDGEVLASAFDNGEIILCDADNGNLLHKVAHVWCPCTSFNWVQCIESQIIQSEQFHCDHSSEYVPNFFPYGTDDISYLAIEESFKKLQGKTVLNVLASGLNDGTILLHSFGMYQLGSIYISLKPYDPIKCKIISVTMFRDLGVLTVVIEREETSNHYEYFYRSYYLSKIQDKINEVESVSLKHSQISTIYSLLCSSFAEIKERWGNLQYQMRALFYYYILQKNEEEKPLVSDEFFELLMFGNSSEALQRFFVCDINEKDLEQVSDSFEAFNSDTQTFIMRRIQIYASAIFYHLNELKSKATWKSVSNLLLEEIALNTCMVTTGSFLLKTVEAKGVIQESIKNTVAFFRWLRVMLLRHNNKPVPKEVIAAAQQNPPFMEDFLKYNFHTSVDANCVTTEIKLEQFGQYLRAEDLSHPATITINPYLQFFNEHPSYCESGFRLDHCPEKSLVGLQLDLRGTLNAALNCREELLGETDLLYSFNLLSLQKNKSPPKISHISCPETASTYIALTDHLPPSSQFIFIRHSRTPEAVMVNFSNSKEQPCSSAIILDKNEDYKIIDIKFYEKCVLLLLEDKLPNSNCTILLQLPFNTLIPNLVPLFPTPDAPVKKMQILNGLQLMEKNWFRKLENICASQMAVNAFRKVVCVYSATQKQVHIFSVGKLGKY